MFRPGIENLYYILTSYPDGTPAETTLELVFYAPLFYDVKAQTDSYGLAQIPIKSASDWEKVVIYANDAQGHKATQEIELQDIQAGEAILLRPERPTYRVGEAMNLTIFTYQINGTVFLDIGQIEQILSLLDRKPEAVAMLRTALNNGYRLLRDAERHWYWAPLQDYAPSQVLVMPKG